MKKILSILILTISFSVFSQNMLDVIHLKNGSIIKGTILEMNPTENIKIQTSDGSVFVYKTSNVVKMTKEKKVNNNLPIQKQSNTIISQKTLDNFFVNYFNQKRPALHFVAVSKVNGIQREVYGQKIYQIEYELLLEPKEDIYINASQFGSAWSNRFVNDFSYSGRPSGGYEAALAGSKKKIQKGQRVLATGTLSFENTDNGWRSNSFKNKTYKVVSSNYVSPKMAKEIAIRKKEEEQLKLIEREKQQKADLEKIERLKKILDWKKPDIKTAESKTEFYQIYNIPYFNNANAKYSVQKSELYAGRNDVFETIQENIYRAIASTKRIHKSNAEKYKTALNKATITFVVESASFNFVVDGYKCYITVKAYLKGNYKEPEKLSVSYTVPFRPNNGMFSRKLSKRQAVENAMVSLRKQVANFIYKYEPFEFEVVKIETSKRGKAEYIVFKRSQQLTQKKIKFMILPKLGLEIKDNAFAIKSKIGECTFKGETTPDTIKCKISGIKNRKAIEKYVNTTEALIGISI